MGVAIILGYIFSALSTSCAAVDMSCEAWLTAMYPWSCTVWMCCDLLMGLSAPDKVVHVVCVYAVAVSSSALMLGGRMACWCDRCQKGRRCQHLCILNSSYYYYYHCYCHYHYCIIFTLIYCHPKEVPFLTVLWLIYWCCPCIEWSMMSWLSIV